MPLFHQSQVWQSLAEQGHQEVNSVHKVTYGFNVQGIRIISRSLG